MTIPDFSLENEGIFPTRNGRNAQYSLMGPEKVPPAHFFRKIFQPATLIRAPRLLSFQFSRRKLKKIGTFLELTMNEIYVARFRKVFACSDVNRDLL